MMRNLIVIGAVILSLTGCIEEKGDKILFVQIGKDKDDLSEQAVIEESLKKGGQITINIALAREIDKDFDEKYSVSDSEGSFLIRPALLNFIGDNGWNYKEAGLGRYTFTQSR
jgi:hypothetical protein